VTVKAEIAVLRRGWVQGLPGAGRSLAEKGGTRGARKNFGSSAASSGAATGADLGRMFKVAAGTAVAVIGARTIAKRVEKRQRNKGSA
jgi:hypothetical protein